MSTSFTMLRLAIARRVVGQVTKASPAMASVASADLDTVYEAIDLRLKELATEGIFWRKVTTTPLISIRRRNTAERISMHLCISPKDETRWTKFRSSS